MAAGWEERAACRTLDPALFYPAKGDTVQAERARAACGRCPVREACLASTLADEKRLRPSDRDGIRGGLDGRERFVVQHGEPKPRKRKRAVREPKPRPLAPCGTLGAVRRHQLRSEPMDAACSAAKAARSRSKRVPAGVGPPECGTRSGFLWHTAHHEIPCEPCTAADVAVTWFIRESPYWGI